MKLLFLLHVFQLFQYRELPCPASGNFAFADDSPRTDALPSLHLPPSAPPSAISKEQFAPSAFVVLGPPPYEMVILA
ncbi:hypothetical protein K505DRAFT_327867 [Melanomma pulvis-pyrius CBS 109.77]|uniref:Secreted protein n=1 Tax=Melanomma pulvis-pyrius CBS 109.77 TaxID=1314802 RepID=A0A6A6X0Z4_9PLEO|nr:hypothetical protein K505DRAFT_327867 [Melanomma pulvis-pyrius CBS 109.77]